MLVIYLIVLRWLVVDPYPRQWLEKLASICLILTCSMIQHTTVVSLVHYNISHLPGQISHLVLTCVQIHACTNYGHYKIVKRILRYISGTLDYGMHILATSSLDLYAFSDANWAGFPLTQRSTTGFCTFLGSNCTSWSAKKQSTVARSSAEAEYRSMESTSVELTWLSFILRDIGVPLYKPPILYCDNTSALYMTINPVFHGRTIHVEIDFHYV